MAKKSSLKTFLAGKNPPNAEEGCLKGSHWLWTITNSLSDDSFKDNNGQIWNVDVLDDGTAITHCTNT